MTRDYSHFLPLTGVGGIPERDRSPLEKLGWQPFFQQQLSLDELDSLAPMRVVEQYSSDLSRMQLFQMTHTRSIQKVVNNDIIMIHCKASLRPAGSVFQTEQ